jgi:hypothetical protein
MADKIINLKINVLAIDQKKLYVGEKGTYLDATLLFNEKKDEYGNNGMIVQQTTKEERLAGNRGNILGNGKVPEYAAQTGANVAFPSAADGAPVTEKKSSTEQLPF